MKTPALRSSAKYVLPIFVLCATPAFAQTPVAEYLFNSSGTAGAVTSTPNSGSDTVAAGLFTGAVLAPGGVSGLAGDSALSLQAATGHGSVSASSISARQIDGAGTPIDNDALDGFVSFTFMGWYNLQQAVNNVGAPRLLGNSNTSIGAAGGAGFGLRMNGTTFQLEVDTASVTSSGTQAGVAFDTANQWVFLALTYNGAAASSNVQFFAGDIDTAVASAFSTVTLNQGTVATETGPLVIGNRAALDRPLDAAIDNFRIFGSQTDASGVLTAAQIEGYRALDVIPEPGSAALLGLGLLAVGARRARRQGC